MIPELQNVVATIQQATALLRTQVPDVQDSPTVLQLAMALRAERQALRIALENVAGRRRLTKQLLQRMLQEIELLERADVATQNDLDRVLNQLDQILQSMGVGR